MEKRDVFYSEEYLKYIAGLDAAKKKTTPVATMKGLYKKMTPGQQKLFDEFQYLKSKARLEEEQELIKKIGYNTKYKKTHGNQR